MIPMLLLLTPPHLCKHLVPIGPLGFGNHLFTILIGLVIFYLVSYAYKTNKNVVVNLFAYNPVKISKYSKERKKYIYICTNPTTTSHNTHTDTLNSAKIKF